MSSAPSLGQSLTNRDAAIQYLADSLGAECAQEDIERLGVSKDECDQRHRGSIEQCKTIAITDLPPQLSQKELATAMLRLSFCRSMVMQGEKFDLAAWEPTITQLLDIAHEEDESLDTTDAFWPTPVLG